MQEIFENKRTYILGDPELDVLGTREKLAPRRAHEWRLTTKSVDRVGGRELATHEWRNWRSKKTKHGSRSEPSGPSVVPFENRRAVLGSKSEPVSPYLEPAVGSETEH